MAFKRKSSVRRKSARRRAPRRTRSAKPRSSVQTVRLVVEQSRGPSDPVAALTSALRQASSPRRARF